MKIIGSNAVIVPVRRICHAECHEDVFLYTIRLTRQLVMKPLARPAIIRKTRSSREDMRPKCIIMAELDKLAKTSRQAPTIFLTERFITFSSCGILGGTAVSQSKSR